MSGGNRIATASDRGGLFPSRRQDRMTTARKGLATLVVVGVTGALAAFGTFSAFSDTESNNGNEFSTGTVTLTENASNAAMFNAVTGAAPGATPVDRCIKVSYTGSLAA